MNNHNLNIDFSTQFDVFYNNITSNQAPGLNPYEKSVFLTKGEYQIVEALYNGNLEGHSFEETEELRRKLDILNRTAQPTPDTSETAPSIHMVQNSLFYDLKQLTDSIMFITMEEIQYADNVSCFGGKTAAVKPVTQDEYARIKNNPFRGVTDNRALRLDYGDKIVEIIPKYAVKNYTIKYLTYPKPIVLENLATYGLNIDGQQAEQSCELDKLLHKDIIERAVMLAKIAWQSALQQNRQ